LAVKNSRPDMIIGHLGSPSFSGLALLETLKLRTFEDMPFFIYSNLNKVETMELCFRLGAWGCINNNINEKDIDDCLSLVA
jgi:DNA-binding NarL/FixJ family response regulator